MLSSQKLIRAVSLARRLFVVFRRKLKSHPFVDVPIVWDSTDAQKHSPQTPSNKVLPMRSLSSVSMVFRVLGYTRLLQTESYWNRPLLG
jgi:hypothetical protein